MPELIVAPKKAAKREGDLIGCNIKTYVAPTKYWFKSKIIKELYDQWHCFMEIHFLYKQSHSWGHFSKSLSLAFRKLLLQIASTCHSVQALLLKWTPLNIKHWIWNVLDVSPTFIEIQDYNIQSSQQSSTHFKSLSFVQPFLLINLLTICIPFQTHSTSP